ncbi:MAG: filamentous hemagglutinin N-terminal domain-containing protein, partial [Pseudomonadota bacterium]
MKVKRLKQQKNYKIKSLAGYIRAAIILPAGILLAQNNAVFAGPEGGQIVGGEGNISTPDANTTLVHQQSQNLAVEWQSFNVQAQELVQFQQPSASSSVLNRILDQNPSQIFGAIEANGRVFLVNPNGIIFSPTASVNVGSLIAAGLDMDTVKFMNGQYEMGVPEGVNPGAVINRGMIKAATGGSVTLVGGAVSNEGLIIADVGYVNLASGRKAVIDFDGNGLIYFQVEESVLENTSDADASVKNSGEIRAEGGTVVMSGHTARDIFSQVVNNEGIVRAGSIDDTGGTIRLTGIGGRIANSGTLDASGATGGEVSITGENIDHSGSINADGSAGNGGSVELVSADTIFVTGNGAISARSESAGQGGSIKVLGDKVGLIDNASLDASGDMGGGEVLVGGDYQGANPEIKNADLTYVGHDVTIQADAHNQGDGGKIVIWSDTNTNYFGTSSARGGETSGNGGTAEVSGKESLTFSGTVDLRAPAGSVGTLLLDPTDIIITDGLSGDSTASLILGATISESGGAGAAVLTDGDLNLQLTFANVEVTTASAGSGTGNLTLDGTALVNGSGNNLTLTSVIGGVVTLDGVISNVSSLILNSAGGVVSGTGSAAGDGTGSLSGITGFNATTDQSNGVTYTGFTAITGNGALDGVTNYDIATGSDGSVTFGGFTAITGDNTGQLDNLGGSYDDGLDTATVGLVTYNSFATINGATAITNANAGFDAGTGTSGNSNTYGAGYASVDGAGTGALTDVTNFDVTTDIDSSTGITYTNFTSVSGDNTGQLDNLGAGYDDGLDTGTFSGVAYNSFATINGATAVTNVTGTFDVLTGISGNGNTYGAGFTTVTGAGAGAQLDNLGDSYDDGLDTATVGLVTYNSFATINGTTGITNANLGFHADTGVSGNSNTYGATYSTVAGAGTVDGLVNYNIASGSDGSVTYSGFTTVTGDNTGQLDNLGVSYDDGGDTATVGLVIYNSFATINGATGITNANLGFHA